MAGVTLQGYDHHKTFTSAFATDQAAREAIGAAPNASEFSRKMARLSAEGSRSEKIRYWLHRTATELIAPKPETSATFPRLLELFKRTLEPSEKDPSRPRLKRAALRIGTLRLSRAGQTARFPDSINVVNSDKWHGRIHTDGRLELRSDLPEPVSRVLEELEADPITYSARHGIETGQCCFCGLELSDPRSVRVGYGPICASNWGLPWGDPPPLADIVEKNGDAE